ncbi:hypothetical protein PtA15_7A159 [Puccinia triticina]|uniref:Fork-head domain-containing protein n=1 Tax=Puccinia triticina TaxID=208348 RepID=A0ABY7CNC1_9BASI|nr:uncharacterized protein PtA15_7A159 [Puccinia triticina]WAQ86433.1 hypothetical protein PtA15_7A159 [Puccinia triticina]
MECPHYHAFRNSLSQQDSNNQHHLKQQLIETIEHATQPQKPERKRSRQRPDSQNTHCTKAARSLASINSTAGLLSRRASQSTNQYHPFHPLLTPPLLNPPTYYPENTPTELSLNNNENSFHPNNNNSNPQPSSHPPPDPLSERHKNLASANEAKNGGETLHLQLSGIISDLTYQQQPQQQIQEPPTAGPTDLAITGPPSAELLEAAAADDHHHRLIRPADRPGKLSFTLPSQSSSIITESTSRPRRPRPLATRPHSKSFTSPRTLGPDHQHCPRIATDSAHTPYTFAATPSLGLPPGARIDLASLPGTLSGLSTTSSAIGLEPSQDEIMQDSMAAPVTQSDALSSSEQIANATLAEHAQPARSRAPTIDSQRPPGGDAEMMRATTIEDTPMDTGDPSGHPLPSPTVMPPPAPDPALLVSSSSTVPGPDDHNQTIIPPPRVPSPPVNRQMGAASAGVSPLLAAQFEPIFNQWLGRLCSDLEMKDAKGEPIHQTLMARKMQRLEESADFRPFKFRIQAFTNSFFEELVRNGFQEKDLPMKKVRQYLWSQSCISRFNEEGKKAKSKGNHVWHIEAKKMMNGQWSFLHFQRKIIGNPPPEAYAGVKWTWTAKVWDPQCSAQNIKAAFSSPDLPPWLAWRGNLLSGVPTLDLIGTSYLITVLAATNPNSKSASSALDLSFTLTVKSPEEMVTSQIDKNQKTEDNNPALQSDSTVPQSSSEQISLDTTPTHSPPDLAGFTNGSSSTTALERIPSGMLQLSSDGKHPTSFNPVPGLSRTDSCESVPISSPILEDPPRLLGHTQQAPFDGLLSESSLLHEFRNAVMKEGDGLDFDSSLDFSSSSSAGHPLAALHLDQQFGLRGPSAVQQSASTMMGASGEGGALPAGLMLIPSTTAGMVAGEMEPEGSAAGGGGGTHGLGDGGGVLLDTLISSSTGAVVVGDLAGDTSLSGPGLTARMLLDATVRENLMSTDAFLSDSAGDLIRTAIVSDDPRARQFAADVLAPMAPAIPVPEDPSPAVGGASTGPAASAAAGTNPSAGLPAPRSVSDSARHPARFSPLLAGTCLFLALVLCSRPLNSQSAA